MSGSGSVGIEAGRVDAERDGQRRDAAVEVNEAVEALALLARVGDRFTDDDEGARAEF